MNTEEAWILKEKYNGEKTEAFFTDCERLKTGEPLAYIIGHIPFLNTTIYLDSHPLIPRTETEFWVAEAITEMQQTTEDISVLDLCAGSGCIGVAVLHAVPHAHVDFIEIDEQHHDTILKNILVNGIDESRARVLGGSLFEKLPNKLYDGILSNPPYIDPACDRTDDNVRAFEPQKALYGGQKGLGFITNIIKEAEEHLTPHGVLYIEHEPEQVEVIKTLGESLGYLVETKTDQYHLLRYTRLSR